MLIKAESQRPKRACIQIESRAMFLRPKQIYRKTEKLSITKKQSNFEKAVQKKAPGVFAPGAFVQLLKVKELFLAFHFCIALAAINRTILPGFERNFCFAAAGSAGGGVHFFLGFDFVFACIAALFATLGLVNEAALCIEFLFAGGESELFSAFFAH